MPAAVSMTLTSKGAAAFRKGDMQKAGRVAMRVVGKLHHRLFKPRKFAPNSSQRYKLKRRSPKYQKANAGRGTNQSDVRSIGENIPFVWSGRTRTIAMGGNKVDARAPSSARHFVDVILNAPQLNQVPWVREEFERINKNEIAELKRAGVKRYERELTRGGRTVQRKSK